MPNPPDERRRAEDAVDRGKTTADEFDDLAWNLDEPASTVRSDDPFASRYEEIGEIGHGGTGVVYRVLDRDLLRAIAMKELRADPASEPHKVRAFLKEAQVTAQLEHPSIPPVHELSPDGRLPYYFTMKLVDGRTLAELADRFPVERDLSARLREVLPVFLKVCDAVAFAHSRGVIHRDIKPENIMVGTFGEVYLMDWGLSRVLGRADANAEPVALRADIALAEQRDKRQVAGTPAFMAPEQAEGRLADLDERTDVFNLGGVLYFIVSGRAPYHGVGLREALRRAALGQYVPLDAAAAPLPPTLCRTVEKALSFAPSARYAGALELKREVERFLRGGLHLPMRSYAAGERIVVEGETGDAAFIIARGRCAGRKLVDGQARTIREIGPGEVFGEMGMLTGAARSATVETLEPTTVTVVTRALIEEGLGHDSWMGALLLTLVERFRDVERRLYERPPGDGEGEG